MLRAISVFLLFLMQSANGQEVRFEPGKFSTVTEVISGFQVFPVTRDTSCENNHRIPTRNFLIIVCKERKVGSLSFNGSEAVLNFFDLPGFVREDVFSKYAGHSAGGRYAIFEDIEDVSTSSYLLDTSDWSFKTVDSNLLLIKPFDSGGMFGYLDGRLWLADIYGNPLREIGGAFQIDDTEYELGAFENATLVAPSFEGNSAAFFVNIGKENPHKAYILVNGLITGEKSIETIWRNDAAQTVQSFGLINKYPIATDPSALNFLARFPQLHL